MNLEDGSRASVYLSAKRVTVVDVLFGSWYNDEIVHRFRNGPFIFHNADFFFGMKDGFISNPLRKLVVANKIEIEIIEHHISQNFEFKSFSNTSLPMILGWLSCPIMEKCQAEAVIK